MELVRSVFDAWNHGELRDILPFVAEDIEWLEVEGLPEAMARKEIRGSETVRTMLESLFEVWEALEAAGLRGEMGA